MPRLRLFNKRIMKVYMKNMKVGTYININLQNSWANFDKCFHWLVFADVTGSNFYFRKRI